jgi:transposase
LCPIKGFIFRAVEMIKNPKTHIKVTIEPRKNNRAKCSCCGKPGSTYDTQPQARIFDHVPIWNVPVRYYYRMRRVDCRHCGSIITEAVPWASGKHRQTNDSRLFLAQWARLLSWKDVARMFHSTWDSVFRSVNWVVQHGLAHRDLEGITAIGVDEVAYSKGHHYMTLIYQINDGARRLLGVVKERKEESLKNWLTQTLTAPQRNHIAFVCSDMWRPYLKVIGQILPHALNILDRFHIAKKLNEAVDEVRRQETKELAAKGYQPVLNKSRYCFLKRKSNLTTKQKVRLNELLRYSLKTVRAYQIKESFDVFWKYKSVAHAQKYFKAWCNRTMRSRLKPMKKFVKTLRRHEELLMNYFRAKKQYHSGMVEGLNLRVGNAIRKAFGYRNFEHLSIALYHQLGALPEPKSTHRFCG